MIKLSTIEKDFNEVEYFVNKYDNEPEFRDNAMRKLIISSAVMTLETIEEKLKQRTISDKTRIVLNAKKYEMIRIADRFIDLK